MSFPKAGEFVWNELGTNNVKAAKEFYEKVFGWSFFDVDMGDMTYTMIKLNDREIGGIWPIPKNMESHIPPHWMTYILVESAAEALKKVKESGGNIVKEVTPAGDMGLFAVVTDPTGAIFAVWEPLRK